MRFLEFDVFAAGLVKRVLPTFLHPPVRFVWRYVVCFYAWWSEYWLTVSLWWHRVRGGTFQSWYAGKLDTWATASEKMKNVEAVRRDEHFMCSGKEDVEVAKSFGLEPHHTLLEFGCGWLRTAAHFIDYLDSGNYFGNDASSERIRIGCKIFEIDPTVEDPPPPRFFVNADNSFDWMENRTVDFLWSHAVFSHLPEEDIETILMNARKVMHEGTQFLFTFNPTPDGWEGENVDVVEMDARNWQQSVGFYKQMGARHGLEITGHPHALTPHESIRPTLCLGVARLAA